MLITLILACSKEQIEVKKQNNIEVSAFKEEQSLTAVDQVLLWIEQENVDLTANNEAILINIFLDKNTGNYDFSFRVEEQLIGKNDDKNLKDKCIDSTGTSWSYCCKNVSGVFSAVNCTNSIPGLDCYNARIESDNDGCYNVFLNAC